MQLPYVPCLAATLHLLTPPASGQGCPAWSRLLSGGGTDRIENWNTMCLASNGDVLIAGFTTSPNFCPRTTTRGLLGTQDGFVTRLGPTGNVIWSMLIGGTGADSVRAVACEPNGDVLIAGFTNGPGPLAATTCAFQTSYGGGPLYGDGFVGRLTNAVSGPPTISWLTLLGGSGDDSVLTVASAPGGLVIVGGWTASANFPLAGAPFQPTHAVYGCGAEGSDGFVAVLDPSLCNSAQLVCSTYFGGDCDDSVWRVALDPQGNLLLAGRTGSSTLPTTVTAFNRMLGGPLDAFVAVLNPGLSACSYSTYLGGSGNDFLWSATVSPKGGFVLGGETTSLNFPTTVGAFQRVHAGGVIYRTDGFLVHLDPAVAGPAGLKWSTYLGGAGDELVAGVAVESSGLVTAVGGTGSNTGLGALGFPVTPGACTVVPPGGGGLPNGPFDAFACRLDPSRSPAAQIVYSTYLGGAAHWDQATNVVLTANGAAVVGGRTWSADFPVTSSLCGPGGGEDAFVTRLDLLPSGVVRYGAPSPPCHGALYLAVNSRPLPGNNSFEVQVNQAPPNAFGALFLGTHVSVPGAILGIDAWLALSGPLLSVTGSTDGLGFARFPMPIPAQVSWPIGGMQTVWLSGCASLVASDALR